MTLKLWKKTKKPNAKLIYISFESAPLTKIELNNVYKKVRGVKILFNQLIKKLPILYQSTHRIFFDSENVELILIYDDFNSLKNFKFKADAWFLDGFAPKKIYLLGIQNFLNKFIYLLIFKEHLVHLQLQDMLEEDCLILDFLCQK